MHIIFTVKIVFNHPKNLKIQKMIVFLLSVDHKRDRFSCFFKDSPVSKYVYQANVTYIIYNIFILNIHTGDRRAGNLNKKSNRVEHAPAHLKLKNRRLWEMLLF